MSRSPKRLSCFLHWTTVKYCSGWLYCQFLSFTLFPHDLSQLACCYFFYCWASQYTTSPLKPQAFLVSSSSSGLFDANVWQNNPNPLHDRLTKL